MLNDTLRVTKMISSSIVGGSTPVVPSIGNHESFPCNNFGPPPLQDWLYGSLAAPDGWGRWLSAEARLSLAKYGYFSVRFPARIKGGNTLKVISVQTNYCNNLAFFLYVNDTDPGNQLHWLINELQESEDRGDEVVHLIGHIPIANQDCRPEWGERFNQVVARYEGVIAAQCYGHTHHDSFALSYVGARASQIQYISPSVTTETEINPSWRYYKVDSRTHQIVDHETWHVNLTEAIETGVPKATLYYSAKTAYDLPTLFAPACARLVDRMVSNDTLFQFFWQHIRHTGFPVKACTGACKESELCALTSGDSGLYRNCTKAPRNGPFLC